VLNGNDGSTWEVKSDQVALADHVGHTVKVKGVVSNVTMHNMKEETKAAAASAGMKKPIPSAEICSSRPSRW
jgi:hypothetical protein